MNESTTTTEQEPRRVSNQPQVDRDLREQRREMVATLVLTRTTYRRIVELLAQPRDQGGLGITVSIGTVASDVAVVRSRWRARMIEDFSGHVSEQMAYYDALLRALTPKALRGDHQAVADLLGVLDRRSKLIGMDKPDRVLVGVGTVGASVDDVAGRWASAPREEQIARTEQILSILVEARQLRLPGGPPLANPPESNVIDLPVPDDAG